MRVTVKFNQIEDRTLAGISYIKDIIIYQMDVGTETYITNEELLVIKSEVRRYLMKNFIYTMVPKDSAILDVRVLHRTNFTKGRSTTLRQYIVNTME